jgi:hypothetical protein
MFSAATAQHVFDPYMSFSDRADEIHMFMQKKKKGQQGMVKALFVLGDDNVDGGLVKHLTKGQGGTEKSLSKEQMTGDWAAQLGLSEDTLSSFEEINRKASHFFVSYNTLESSLLASSVIVCLSGVVLSSEYFANGVNAMSKLVLTYILMVLITASVFYLGYAFLKEMQGRAKVLHMKSKFEWQHAKLLVKRKLKSAMAKKSEEEKIAAKAVRETELAERHREVVEKEIEAARVIKNKVQTPLSPVDDKEQEFVGDFDWTEPDENLGAEFNWVELQRPSQVGDGQDKVGRSKGKQKKKRKSVIEGSKKSSSKSARKSAKKGARKSEKPSKKKKRKSKAPHV